MQKETGAEYYFIFFLYFFKLHLFKHYLLLYLFITTATAYSK